jgi:hypothetical protein
MGETGHSRRAVLGLMATAPLGGAAPVAAFAVPQTAGAVIDVRNFGAAGDGTADDRAAIQAAIDHALAAGGTLSFTTGVYRVTGPLRFGASVLNGPWAAVLGRTDRLPDRVSADAAAEVANKERLRPITVSCTGDVIIAADFEPRVPTPVIEFNLTHYRAEARWDGRCIICPIGHVTPTGYEGYQETTAPAPRNNLIGFALCGSGLKSLSGLHFGYLQCGLASVGSYWTRFSDLRADRCADAFHFARANAVIIDNLVSWYCDRGLIFDGQASHVRGFHCQQVAEEITILFAESSTFTSFYLEDVSDRSGGGRFAMRLGAAPEQPRVLASRFEGIRISSLRPGKKPWRIFGSQLVALEGCRSYSTVPSDRDQTSQLDIRNCDETTVRSLGLERAR